MKNTLTHTALAAAALLVCATGPAFAQAQQSTSFTGLGIGVSVASSQNKLDFEPAAPGPFEGTDSAADLVASYGFNMGSQWVGTRMQDHIYDLGKNGATVNGNPATMVLDLRVQPGGSAAAQSLIQYGAKNNVTVIVKEFK